MFAYAPVAIQQAPYESTMGLVQKIFYFHVPVVDRDVQLRRSSAASAAPVFLFSGRQETRIGSRTRRGGARGRVRLDRPADRPALGP